MAESTETLPLTFHSNQRSERDLFPRGFDDDDRVEAQRDPKIRGQHRQPKTVTERPGVNQNAYQGKSKWVG